MNKKYIVKNCPSVYSKHYKCDGIYYGPCQDCTDCLIKQVVNKCKGNKEYALEYLGHRDMLAEEILQLFEIEEVNNDR